MASEATHGTRVYPQKPANVYLFATCLVDQFAPQAGLDTVRLLERAGWRCNSSSCLRNRGRWWCHRVPVAA